MRDCKYIQCVDSHNRYRLPDHEFKSSSKSQIQNFICIDRNVVAQLTYVLKMPK